jgi:hypothetical protein
MENESFDLISDKPIYRKSHLLIAAIFGGPLAIVYILAANFRQLGYSNKVSKTWIYGILFSLVFVAFVLIQQRNLKAPTLLPAVISILLGLAVMQSWQGEDINLHQVQGSPFYTNGRAFLIGVISLVITILFLFILLALLYMIFGIDFSKTSGSVI